VKEKTKAELVWVATVARGYRYGQRQWHGMGLRPLPCPTRYARTHVAAPSQMSPALHVLSRFLHGSGIGIGIGRPHRGRRYSKQWQQRRAGADRAQTPRPTENSVANNAARAPAPRGRRPTVREPSAMQACRGHRLRCLPAASAALSALASGAEARGRPALTCGRAPGPRVMAAPPGSWLWAPSSWKFLTRLECPSEMPLMGDQFCARVSFIKARPKVSVMSLDGSGDHRTVDLLAAAQHMTRPHSKSEYRVLGNSSVV
jgi:hypothetical protein